MPSPAHNCEYNSSKDDPSRLDSMLNGISLQARAKDWKATCKTTPDGKTELTVVLTERKATTNEAAK